MNKLISVIFLMFLLVIGVSCQKEGSSDSSKTHEGHEHSKTKVYYTCSMHPQIKEKEMGKCPICHMNLTKIEVDDALEDVAPLGPWYSKLLVNHWTDTRQKAYDEAGWSYVVPVDDCGGMTSYLEGDVELPEEWKKAKSLSPRAYAERVGRYLRSRWGN